MWRLERELNPWPFGRKASTLPKRHHVPLQSCLIMYICDTAVSQTMILAHYSHNYVVLLESVSPISWLCANYRSRAPLDINCWTSAKQIRAQHQYHGLPLAYRTWSFGFALPPPAIIVLWQHHGPLTLFIVVFLHHLHLNAAFTNLFSSPETDSIMDLSLQWTTLWTTTGVDLSKILGGQTKILGVGKRW